MHTRILIAATVFTASSAFAGQVTATKICGVPVLDQNIATAKVSVRDWVIAKAQHLHFNWRECNFNGTYVIVSFNNEPIDSPRFISEARVFRPN